MNPGELSKDHRYEEDYHDAEPLGLCRICGVPAESHDDQCPYGQSDCETTRGGVCVCAMPAALSSKPLCEKHVVPGTVFVTRLDPCPWCEIERLRAALEKYGFHLDACLAPKVIESTCTCGWNDFDESLRDDRPADEPKASPVLERSADRVQFLHRWMRTANPNFGGATPLAMLKAGRGVRLADFLEEAHEANGGDAEETSV